MPRLHLVADVTNNQARLGHQEGGRVFFEGPKFFELCPIISNHVQHIFPGGGNFSRTDSPPCAPSRYGPANHHEELMES